MSQALFVFDPDNDFQQYRLRCQQRRHQALDRSTRLPTRGLDYLAAARLRQTLHDQESVPGRLLDANSTGTLALQVKMGLILTRYQLFYTGYGAIVLHGIALGGTGKHTKELTLDGAEISLRAWYLCEVLYAPMSACIRTSIAVFLLRLSVKTWHRWTIYVVLVITWLVSVGFFVPMVIQCFPPSYFWKQVKGAEGTCMNPVVVPLTAVVHGVISSICDWILGLFPIALLWNVQINRCTKFGIAALLSMGIM